MVGGITLGVGWRKLILRIGEELQVLRTGRFKYFERGGECINGPVSLLSGCVFLRLSTNFVLIYPTRTALRRRQRF